MIKNEELNKLTKQKHDLIRQLENKEITQEKFDEGYVKIRKDIDVLEKKEGSGMSNSGIKVAEQITKEMKKKPKKKKRKPNITERIKLLIEDVIKLEGEKDLYAKVLLRIDPLTDKVRMQVSKVVNRRKK